jgi:hypothetical protein
MPRNLRNFWLEANIDGLSRPFASGPRNKEGNMTLNLSTAINGESVRVLKVECYPGENGHNRIYINIKDYPKTITLDFEC